MNGDEAAAQRREAAGRLAIAREDVRVARARLALDPPAFGMAPYHCQQAAEKPTKGLLADAGWHPKRRTTWTSRPILPPAHYPAARLVLDAIRPRTVWGFAYRYPSMEDNAEPSLTTPISGAPLISSRTWPSGCQSLWLVSAQSPAQVRRARARLRALRSVCSPRRCATPHGSPMAWISVNH